MRVFRSVVLSCAAIAALSGQSPAPSGDPKPLRHLEYAFTADYQITGEGHNAGFSSGGLGSNGSGVNSLARTGGRVGTVDVDVIGFADDGALAFRIAEWIRAEPRPRTTLTCEAEDSGQVVCDAPFVPTDVEGVLLQALSRGFVDDTVVDASGHWTRTYATKHLKVTSTYAMTDPGAGKPVSIAFHREVVCPDGTDSNWHEQGEIAYDRSLKAPKSIHELADEVPRGGSVEHATFDLTIAKDSFATVSPATGVTPSPDPWTGEMYPVGTKPSPSP